MKKTITQTVKLNDKEICDILREVVAKKFNVSSDSLHTSIAVSKGYGGDYREPSTPDSFSVSLSFSSELDI